MVLHAPQLEAEAQVNVPCGWPDNDETLTLVSLSALHTGAELMPSTEVLAQLHSEAGRQGLVKFLGAVLALLADR